MPFSFIFIFCFIILIMYLLFNFRRNFIITNYFISFNLLLKTRGIFIISNCRTILI